MEALLILLFGILILVRTYEKDTQRLVSVIMIVVAILIGGYLSHFLR